MKMHQGRIFGRALGVTVAGLLCLPSLSFAETAPTMRVERTPHYTLNLAIGQVQPMVSAMDAVHGMAGEVAGNDSMMSHDANTMSEPMDQGMAANHYLEVHIAQADSGTIVMDVSPTIRIVDKATGESRDLPHVMGMYGASMGMSDFNYGQNVFLPDGTYLVKVLVGPDTSEFRDVMIQAGPMMADHAMAGDTGMAHDMGMAPGTARDGHMF